MKPVFWTLIILFFSVALILVFVLAGGYNVAATKPHGGLMDWFLVTVRDNSIKSRAAELEAPNLDREDRVASGVAHFQAMCVTCHGAPGIEPSETGKGLYPPPPDLAHSARQKTAEELFWVIKHGIKMTGMPAYGPTHDDESLWDIVAFLRVLPDTSPEKYREMLARQGLSPEIGHGGQGHSHGGAGSGASAHPEEGSEGEAHEGHSHGTQGTAPHSDEGHQVKEPGSEHEHEHAGPHRH
ncbi:MAG: hypothetical protein Kow00109_13960 [Acidobacteriota bacterium]